MKKRFMIGGIFALLVLTGCQSEEVQVEQQQLVKKAAKESGAVAHYETYQQQYEDALSKVVALERTLATDKPNEVRVHYEKRVKIWKGYMNELLNQLKMTMPANDWHAIQAEQERWYPQMELAANKAAKAEETEADALIAYLNKKEDALQIRSRYLLDEYYFKQQK